MKNYNFIERAANGEVIILKEMESFCSWDEAQPFLIEVGKRARALATESKMFLHKMMMKEIESCYYKALHADCGFTMHSQCEMALGWFSKMVRKEC